MFAVFYSARYYTMYIQINNSYCVIDKINKQFCRYPSGVIQEQESENNKKSLRCDMSDTEV